MLMGEKGIRGSGECATEIRCHGIDHVFLPKEAVAAAGSEVSHGQTGNAAQPLDLAPEFSFCPGIQDVETELTQFFQSGSSLEFVENGKRVEFPHRGFGPKAVERQEELSVLDR